MRILALAALAAAFFVTSCASVQTAEPVCLPRDQMLAALAQRFGEYPAIIGKSENGVMEFLASERDSWTIIETGPDGISCILAGGVQAQLILAGQPV